MKRVFFCLIIFCAALSAQVPTCNLTLTATGASTTAWYNNQTTLCRSFTATYAASGFSALSFELDGAPCGATCATQGTAVAISTIQGANPSTDTGEATIATNLYYPWIRLNLSSATGTGTFSATAMGYPGLSARSNTIPVFPFTLSLRDGLLYGPFIDGPTVLSYWSGAIASGHNEIYTVPSGRKALCIQLGVFVPTGLASTVYWPEVKIAGTYYPFQGTNTATANSIQTSTEPPFIMTAGQTFTVNTSTTGQANVYVSILEFNAASPLKTAYITTVAVGNNTVYQTPAGKHTTVFNPQSPGFTYTNFSGGNVTEQWNFVPSGQSQGVSTALCNSAVKGDKAIAQCPVPVTMSPGDALVINVSANTAGQLAFVTLWEY